MTAVDRAGNTSTAGTGFWYRDSLTPVPVVNDGPSDPTTATGATFTFASSEGGVSFGCSLDGSPFTACTTGKVYSSLGLGTHTFKVRATDSNGNTADSATYTWHVVATRPSTCLDEPGRAAGGQHLRHDRHVRLHDDGRDHGGLHSGLGPGRRLRHRQCADRRRVSRTARTPSP